VVLNVGQELGQRKHPVRDIGLKYRVSCKYNNGMYDVRLEEFEEFPDGTNMPVVLAYRVLEPELGSIQHLCPVAVVGTRKDPPLVVLGLDYKYAESGYKDVIDLSGAIHQSKRNVVKEVVVRWTEPCLYFAR
jgi:hypothetical protein